MQKLAMDAHFEQPISVRRETSPSRNLIVKKEFVETKEIKVLTYVFPKEEIFCPTASLRVRRIAERFRPLSQRQWKIQREGDSELPVYTSLPTGT